MWVEGSSRGVAVLPITPSKRQPLPPGKMRIFQLRERDWSLDINRRFQLLFILVLVAVTILPARSGAQVTESEHRAGPHGLEGWTLSQPVPEIHGGHEPLPFTLIIARNRKVIRRIEGGAFLWKWIFWADGRQVAYESGPLHFSLACSLLDLKTGRELQSLDCFHGLPSNAPEWAKALEASR